MNESNPYLSMNIERVRQDAEHGVSLARSALRQRDPRAADRLGIGHEPRQENVIRAMRAFFGSRRAGKMKQSRAGRATQA